MKWEHILSTSITFTHVSHMHESFLTAPSASFNVCVCVFFRHSRFIVVVCLFADENRPCTKIFSLFSHFIIIIINVIFCHLLLSPCLVWSPFFLFLFVMYAPSVMSWKWGCEKRFHPTVIIIISVITIHIGKRFVALYVTLWNVNVSC